MKILFPDGFQISAETQMKLQRAFANANSILEQAEKLRTTQLDGKISFKFQAAVPRDILTEYERAQSAAFFSRYEHLPELDELRFINRNGYLYLESIHEVRHAFNEYRPIFMNQSDSSYYVGVHKTVRQKLLNLDQSKDLQIIVNHETDGNISTKFAAILKEREKSIRKVIELSDFDYIYNGFLQHSDSRFTARFRNEYTSGELNYVFIKNLSLLPYLKDALRWHHVILGTLTFPKLGPL